MYLAIDVGGTKTAIGLFASLDKPEIIKSAKFVNTNDYQKDTSQLIEQIRILAANENLSSIGIGLPGIMNVEKTGIRLSVNLSSWQGQNIRELLSHEFKVPIYLDQDVANAALGEYKYGNHGNKDFIFLIWGTGFGGTKVYKHNNKITLETFEAGYQIISKKEGFEYLEFNIGGKGIENRFGKKAENLDESEWEPIIEDLTIGIYNMQVLCGFKVFVIGGGIALKQKHRLSNLTSRLRQKLEILEFEPAEILISTLGEEAGLFGSLALQDRN